MLKFCVLLAVSATLGLGAACSGLAINPITGLLDCVGASGGGGTGTVTSISTTSPLTGGIITDSGTIACATCVTSAAALTNNALMTGGGLQASKTPAATATMDTSGNISTPGGVTTGVGGSAAGGYAMGQGTPAAAATASVGFQAPATVTTKFMMTLPAAPTTGFMLNTGTSDPSTITYVSTIAVANGGTGTASTLTGLVRGSASAMTAAELSGDVTTSGSNAATIANSAVTSAKLNITTTTCTYPSVLTAIGATAVGTCTVPTIPQNSQSAAYTTVLGDAGKHIYHPGADTTARTWTIDSNANVAYPVGTCLSFINDTSGGVVTIAITSDTMILAGAGTTGSRSLAANGIATACKMTSTRWIINGTGLT